MVAGDINTYTRLIKILDDCGIKYRIIDHPPEGRTIEASAIRGHPAAQAAKCMVVEIQVERYALCVVPGDARVDFEAVRQIYGGRRARLAPQEKAESLTCCESGTIIPFSFIPSELDLIADPSLLGQDQLYFNAARMDRSLEISADDFLQVAKPRLAKVANYGGREVVR